MSTTATDGLTVITPILVAGFEATRTGKNTLHDIIGRPDKEVTLHPAGLRSGTLTFLLPNLAQAFAAEQMHSQPKVFTFTPDGLDELSMRYVLDGSIVTALDPESRELWTVAVDFQEVV